MSKKSENILNVAVVLGWLSLGFSLYGAGRTFGEVAENERWVNKVYDLAEEYPFGTDSKTEEEGD